MNAPNRRPEVKPAKLETAAAARCLEALGSPVRLEMFRLLVKAGPGGAVVGQLQEHLGIPASTLSHHLARLVRVGLVSQERHSRTLVCRADYERMHGLLAYLGDNCCEGLEVVSCSGNPESLVRTEAEGNDASGDAA